jgi:hypothetical protein
MGSFGVGGFPMAREKTAWGTVVGTGAASIDAVVMDIPVGRQFTEDEVEAEIRRRGLPERGAIGRHLDTLQDRGYVQRRDGGWRRVR